MPCRGFTGVVLLNEQFLRAEWPMWELGVMMAALPDCRQRELDHSRQAARTVVPIILMDIKKVAAVYGEHWTPEVVEAARAEGLLPATLADVRSLLSYVGDRQDQVRPVQR